MLKNTDVLKITDVSKFKAIINTPVKTVLIVEIFRPIRIYQSCATLPPLYTYTYTYMSKTNYDVDIGDIVHNMTISISVLISSISIPW